MGRDPWDSVIAPQTPSPSVPFLVSCEVPIVNWLGSESQLVGPAGLIRAVIWFCWMPCILFEVDKH